MATIPPKMAEMIREYYESTPIFGQEHIARMRKQMLERAEYLFDPRIERADYRWDTSAERDHTVHVTVRASYPDTPKGRQQERLAEVRPTITAKEANEWLASLPPIPLA